MSIGWKISGYGSGYTGGQKSKASSKKSGTSVTFSASKSKQGPTKRMNFNSAGAMMQIARATTKSQVAAIERLLRAKVQEAKQCDSDSATIKAIKKSAAKAAAKVKALGKEERMENMRRAAAAGNNFQEEARIRQELEQKRRARIRKEKADIEQAKLEDMGRGTGESRIEALYKEELRALQREQALKENLESCCEGTEVSTELIADVGETPVGPEGAVVDIML